MSAPGRHRNDLIGLFAHHKVAANLLMVIMLLTGAFALDRLNVQFFPTFELDIVSVRVVWSGASAEDIEDGITNPLEQRLRTVDNLDKMTSTSSQGIASITLEFEEGVDPLLALDEVRRAVDEFRNFPLRAGRAAADHRSGRSRRDAAARAPLRVRAARARARPGPDHRPPG
jgi:multidrug efflux pump subunit AcrB